jgi:hypothetical protein
MPSSVPCLHPIARSYWQHLLCAHFLHKQQYRHAKSELAKKAEPQDPPKGPLQIIISIADQQLSLYDNGALIARSSVSTGVRVIQHLSASSA